MAENSGKSEPLSPSPGFSLPPRALGGRPRCGRGPCCVAGSRLIRRELNEANICLPSLSVPSSLLTCPALMGCDVIPAVVPPLQRGIDAPSAGELADPLSQQISPFESRYLNKLLKETNKILKIVIYFLMLLLKKRRAQLPKVRPIAGNVSLDPGLRLNSPCFLSWKLIWRRIFSWKGTLNMLLPVSCRAF